MHSDGGLVRVSDIYIKQTAYIHGVMQIAIPSSRLRKAISLHLQEFLPGSRTTRVNNGPLEIDSLADVPIKLFKLLISTSL